MNDLTEAQKDWILKAEQAGVLSAQQAAWLDAARANGVMPAADMPWLDVAKGAVTNAPESALQFGKDLVHPIMHPIDTAGSLYDLAKGLVYKMVPGKQEDEATVDAVGKFLADRYGSMEGFKKTIATDPVGVMADVSMVLTGGAAAAARIPGKAASTVAKVSQKAAQAVDPLAATAKAVSKSTKPVGILASHIIGDLGTHTGAESIQRAYKAGKKGSPDFLDNMRGNVPIETVLEDAKMALSEMYKQRSDAYKKGMTGVRLDKTVLDFSPIDKALLDAKKIGNYEGKNIKKSTGDTWTKVDDVIEEWRGSDPAVFHTPEGLDALKQAIGDIRDTTEYRTPSRIVADQAYNAVKKQIVKQAPSYAKVMKEYETASDVVRDIEKTLSLNAKANVDTSIRKLQSIMRNNVNTNYGKRAEQVKMLEEAGGANITEKLAGQSLNSLAPRGLGRAVAGSAAVGGAAINPALLATLPLQSPRIMGETAYASGAARRGAGKAAKALGASPERAHLLGQDLFQLGRAQRIEEEYRGLLAP